MLRIKRSVAASFSQTHFNSALSEAALAAAAGVCFRWCKHAQLCICCWWIWSLAPATAQPKDESSH